MHKTVSVYFSGTGFDISDINFLAGALYHNTQESDTQKRFGFNGCGVDYGFMGAIFGTGLDKQCQEVIDYLEMEISMGNTITLNVYGHRRRY